MSTGGGDPFRLSTDEVAIVLRRAAELEAETSGIDPDQGFDAVVILDAAEEVGLSPYAVRQALAELQSGTLPVPQGTRGYVARLVGPSTVVESRVVPSPPGQILENADDFFRRRSFEPRRRQGSSTVYRERRDLWRHVRRVVDVIEGGGTLAGVQAVTMTISPISEGQTMVRTAATLAPGRRGVVTMATGYSVIGVTGIVAVTAADPVVLMIGAPFGALVGVGGLRRRRRWRDRRHEQVGDLLASLLDRLR